MWFVQWDTVKPYRRRVWYFEMIIENPKLNSVLVSAVCNSIYVNIDCVAQDSIFIGERERMKGSDMDLSLPTETGNEPWLRRG